MPQKEFYLVGHNSYCTLKNLQDRLATMIYELASLVFQLRMRGNDKEVKELIEVYIKAIRAYADALKTLMISDEEE